MTDEQMDRWKKSTGPAGRDGVARLGFKGGPHKGNYPVQFNKAACIITVQFTSWGEIESLRNGGRKREQLKEEREVDKQVNKEEIIKREKEIHFAQ